MEELSGCHKKVMQYLQFASWSANPKIFSLDLFCFKSLLRPVLDLRLLGYSVVECKVWRFLAFHVIYINKIETPTLLNIKYYIDSEVLFLDLQKKF